MSSALKTADAKFLFTVPDSLNVAVSAAVNAGIPQAQIFLLEGRTDGFTTVQELIAIGKSYGHHSQLLPYSIPKGQTNGQVCGFLCFSSGTTGLPKAVSSLSAGVLEAHEADGLPGYAFSPEYNRSGLSVEDD